AHAASYAPKAVAQGGGVAVRARQGMQDENALDLDVVPQRLGDAWGETPWDDVKAVIRAEARERLAVMSHAHVTDRNTTEN
ncbi:tRNA(5-methylaminomethyl-2-thiouridylate) methyltransferase, partial [Desulfovibrio sp. 1188_IL3213]